MPVNDTLGGRKRQGLMSAVTACRTCGTKMREGARFCHGCGVPVTAHDTHAEHKQVTHIALAEAMP
jgi:hypothetical protein